MGAWGGDISYGITFRHKGINLKMINMGLFLSYVNSVQPLHISSHKMITLFKNKIFKYVYGNQPRFI